MSTQWHPLFAELLKIVMEPYFDLEPEYPVSELPRRADVLLLRKRDSASLPFIGIWGGLSKINVIEYKSPDDPANLRHLQRLQHVGSGIALRLDEQAEVGELPFDYRDVSLWLLTPGLTRSLVDAFTAYDLRPIEHTPGLHRGRVGFHPVWVVDYNLAVAELDTLPLHLLEPVPLARPGLVEVLLSHPELIERMASLVNTLQPELWRLLAMSMLKRSGPVIRWDVIAENGTDLTPVLQYLTPEERLAGLTPEIIARHLKPEDRLAGLKPEDRLAGLTIEQIEAVLQQRRQSTSPSVAPPTS